MKAAFQSSLFSSNSVQTMQYKSVYVHLPQIHN